MLTCRVQIGRRTWTWTATNITPGQLPTVENRYAIVRTCADRFTRRDFVSHTPIDGLGKLMCKMIERLPPT